MGQTSGELKREVDLARSRLDSDINRLQYHVRRELDWRTRFERSPWKFLGAAFAVGVLIALRLPAGRRSDRRQ
jgi:hypothetical protein